MWRSRFIFVIFYFTALLVATVHLRTTSSQIFYRSRTAGVAQNRLKQQLWQKQLMLASMINPTVLPDPAALKDLDQ